MAGDVYPPGFDSTDPAVRKIAEIRNLINDVEQLPNTLDFEADDEYLFSDSQLAMYLVTAGGSALRASAYAYEALGATEAIISKVITTEDLSTNGASILNAFILLAKQRHAQADAEDAATAAEEAVYITPFVDYSRCAPQAHTFEYGV